jgi:hypothetical protein
MCVTTCDVNLHSPLMGHQEGWTWYLDLLGQRFEKVAARRKRNNGMPAEADIPLRYRATTSGYLRMTTIIRTR